LAGIQELKSAPIELDGRLRSFTLTRVVQAPSETWSARIEPDRVRVDVTIVERSSRRELEGVRVQLVVRPDTPPIRLASEGGVKLVLKGRSDLLALLTASNLTAYVDCSDLEPGEVRDVPFFVPTKPGVDLVSVEPATIRVEMPQP
jgi:hypothetical protein